MAYLVDQYQPPTVVICLDLVSFLDPSGLVSNPVLNALAQFLCQEAAFSVRDILQNELRGFMRNFREFQAKTALQAKMRESQVRNLSGVLVVIEILGVHAGDRVRIVRLRERRQCSGNLIGNDP